MAAGFDRVYGIGEKDENGLCILPDDLQQKAVVELHEPEDKAVRLAFLNDLKAAILAHSRYAAVKDTADLRYPSLLRFARGRKFRMDECVDLFFNFYEFPTKHNLMSDVVKAISLLGAGASIWTPCRCMDGSSIITLSMMAMTFLPTTNSELNGSNLLQFRDRFNSEHTLEDEATQICGVSMLEDLNMPGGSMTTISVDNESMAVAREGLEKAYPMRFRAIFAINPPWYIGPLFAVAKWVLPKKLRERVHICSNQADIFQWIAPAHVPLGYGGEFDEASFWKHHMSLVAQNAGVPLRYWTRVVLQGQVPPANGTLGCEAFTHADKILGGKVEITIVNPDGVGAQVGLQPGDRVIKVNNSYVTKTKDIKIHSNTQNGMFTIEVSRLIEYPYFEWENAKNYHFFVPSPPTASVDQVTVEV